ncbi:MAG: LysR family transcriptional regulator [Methyloligellaceae bacterium]
MAKRLPPLAQLRALKHVARLGSFSRAADELGLTQPAVSVQIRRLEDDLGVALIERIGKRAAATAAGSLLLEHAERAFAELEVACDRLRATSDRLAGEVRIGAGATATIHLLPDPLGRLRSEHPDLEFSVVTGNTPQLVEAVVASDLDLAIVTLPVVHRALATAPFFVDSLIGVAPVAFEAAAPLTPAALAAHPLVLYERGGLIRRTIDDWFRAGEAKPEKILEIGDAEALKRMVQAGLGLSITSSISIEAERKAGLLVGLPLKPRLERQLALLWRGDRSANPLIKAVLSVLQGGDVGENGQAETSA